MYVSGQRRKERKGVGKKNGEGTYEYKIISESAGFNGKEGRKKTRIEVNKKGMKI